MNFDKFAKASQGRYFPLTATETITAVSQRTFSVFSYHNRIPIKQENCKYVYSLGHQLASFHRMGYIAFFSLPDEVAKALGANAVQRTIVEFSRIDKTPHLAVRPQQFVIYRAFLGALGRLSVVYGVVSARSHSYLAFDAASQLARPSDKSGGKSNFAPIMSTDISGSPD